MKNQKFFTVATIFVFSLSFNVLANSSSITDAKINDIEKSKRSFIQRTC